MVHFAVNPETKPDHSFAIVTPTFLPDLSRCELLAESLDRTAPHVSHYIIVARHELSAFKHFKGRRRTLIEAEEILGKWIVRFPGRKGGIWLNLRAPPVRGWIIQQILKIGVTKIVPERTLVLCDSDVAFFRPFNRDDFLVNGKVGLLDVDFNNEMSRQWTATARRLLGLSSLEGAYRNYVGSVICWNRETLMAMQQKIESCIGINWQIALARTSTFSEYMIYGIFVREVLGYDQVDHAPSSVPLVKHSWGVNLSTASAIDAFFSDFDPRTIAVMIHSKDGIDVFRYRANLKRLWEMEHR